MKQQEESQLVNFHYTDHIFFFIFTKEGKGQKKG